jgi:phosphatidate cytidylyltransferase
VNNRYIGALLISPFFIFVFLGDYYLAAFIMVISLIAMREFYNSIKTKNFKPSTIICYAASIIYYALLMINKNGDHLGSFLVILTLVLLCIPVINIKFSFIDSALSLLGVIYVSVFFSFIPLINFKVGGNVLVWLVFITSWGCDTAAYYSGKAFGKRKLCPKVSPKKTIEGSIGGALGAAIITLLFGLIMESRFSIMNPIHYAVIGLICGAISQFGDLVASSIKRYVGVKDYSNLIPGHGGILDRFDSIIFSSVVIYYYLTIIINI